VRNAPKAAAKELTDPSNVHKASRTNGENNLHMICCRNGKRYGWDWGLSSAARDMECNAFYFTVLLHTGLILLCLWSLKVPLGLAVSL